MDLLPVTFLITILKFQLSRGQIEYAVRIYPAEKYVASIGENVTFSCLVTGHQRNDGPSIHAFWQHGGKTVKHCQFPPKPNRDVFDERCNLTVYRVAMERQYKCTLFYQGTQTETLLVEVIVPVIDIRDLYTGNLIDSDTRPSCVLPGSARNFECTVRDAHPGHWEITWIIDRELVVTGSEVKESGGLANVSSRLTVSSLPIQLVKNLTCQASCVDTQLLSRTVQLQACH
ncbi:uncharacterized protein LOC110990568, partial [Acanthaster planci]|uniref:Uncharacterized protein LOC110990568 n=1 Tax=Acanthaster planci TaxID=133434 RepID=A0A8B8A0V3_ACAPL